MRSGKPGHGTGHIAHSTTTQTRHACAEPAPADLQAQRSSPAQAVRQLSQHPGAKHARDFYCGQIPTP